MKPQNGYLTVLGWTSAAGLILGPIFFFIGITLQANAGYLSDGGEGVVPIAIGGATFQFGAVALLLWLVGKAIVHQLALGRPQSSVETESAAETG